MKIYLAGDSTVQTYDDSWAPQAGWGQLIASYFTAEAQFINRAIGGRSSKTFVLEGRLDAILNEIGGGDYLFIQMGHNDSTVSKPERYTDPYIDYKTYLKQYVDGARRRGAIPVLITPVGRLHHEEGKFINDFPDYCSAMKLLAAEEQVELIDLMAKSLDDFAAVGYEETYSYFMVSANGTDHTHFTEKGANRMAKLVAEGVKELQLEVSQYVRNHAEAKIRVFLAGDSTMADYPSSQSPMAGWGQMLGEFFSGEVAIRNEARCGRSSKSFIQEGHFPRITANIGEGDVLLIQFGHNDEKPNQTEPFSSFQAYLSKYIDEARRKGAIPVLITPVERRRFDEDGKLVGTHGEYPDAVRELAAKQQVPLIDLCAATGELYQAYGPEDSKRLFVWFAPGENSNYPDGVEDNTHFSEYGAREVAKLAVERMKESKLPLAVYLK